MFKLPVVNIEMKNPHVDETVAAVANRSEVATESVLPSSRLHPINPSQWDNPPAIGQRIITHQMIIGRVLPWRAHPERSHVVDAE